MDTQEVRSIYNDQIPNKYHHEYEEKRWFSNPIRKAGYDMTKTMIERHLIPQRCTKMLEVGPGAGTWTKVVSESHPKAMFHLVDISKEMLALAKAATTGHEDIAYFEADFLQFRPKERYDVIFSSRAIEYIPDQKRVLQKMAHALRPDGIGMIITKAPKYLRAKLLRRTINSFHSGQIAPGLMKKYLIESGIAKKDITLYPVTMSMPFFKSPKANMALFKLFSQMPLNPVSQFFAESYCVVFKKSS